MFTSLCVWLMCFIVCVVELFKDSYFVSFAAAIVFAALVLIEAVRIDRKMKGGNKNEDQEYLAAE